MALVRTYTVSATAVQRDETLSPRERSALQEEYIRLALAELRRCRDSGYFNDENKRKELNADPYLGPIRSRPEFPKLVGQRRGKDSPSSAKRVDS